MAMACGSHLGIAHSPAGCKNIWALREGVRDRPSECSDPRTDPWHAKSCNRLQPGLWVAGWPKRTVPARSWTSAVATGSHLACMDITGGFMRFCR